MLYYQSMLPVENRLAKVRDFNLVMKQGRWTNGTFLDIKVLDLAKNRDYFPAKEDSNAFEKQLKIAFTVGLKVSKKAVERNRIKRQTREVVRLLLKDNKLKSGYYLLFVARPTIKDKDFTEISQETNLLLERARMFA